MENSSTILKHKNTDGTTTQQELSSTDRKQIGSPQQLQSGIPQLRTQPSVSNKQIKGYCLLRINVEVE